MKSMTALVLALAAVFVACAQNEPHLFWYEVTISGVSIAEASMSGYAFRGTSTLAETELARFIGKGQELVKLDNLIYQDRSGKIQNWQEWDRSVEPRIYINPKNIVTVRPLVGDPRKAPARATDK